MVHGARVSVLSHDEPLIVDLVGESALPGASAGARSVERGEGGIDRRTRLGIGQFRWHDGRPWGRVKSGPVWLQAEVANSASRVA